MSTAEKIGRKTIRIANGLVNLFVLIAILLMAAFAAYALWDSGQVHSAASLRNYERYNPTSADGAQSFSDLQAINPDVFAWLTVYGTNIDYPVVQGEDNIRYVNTDARGRHSLSGAIFLDHRSSRDFSDLSSIIYGHHMENRVMFGEIGMFSDREYFSERRYGMLYFGGREHGLEFFAFVHADAYDNAVFRAPITQHQDQGEYLELLLQMATHIREDVRVSYRDRIVLLSTCSSDSTNGRDILIGKITDDTYVNPFYIEQANATVPVIDELSGLWTQLDLWARVSIMVLIAMLILSAIILICKRRKPSKVTRRKTKKTKGGP